MRVLRISIFTIIIVLGIWGVTLQIPTSQEAVRYTAHFDESLPCSLHVLEVDLTHPGVHFRSVLSSNDDRQQLPGLERLTSMISRFDDQDYSIGGINADFFRFDSGYPVNLHVGDFIPATPSHHRAVFGKTSADSLFISPIDFEARLEYDGASQHINAVNPLYRTSEPTLYTSHIGKPIHTDSTGAALGFEHHGEGIFKQKSPEWMYGEIPPHSFDLILTIPDHTMEAEGLRLSLHYKPLTHPVAQAVGGGPQLVADGELVVDFAAEKEGIGSDFVETRHPRTAIGFNADQSMLYLVVADGRSEESAGMNLYELGEFMIDLGADHALNLDGGGSTTMVWDGKIKNQPSDENGERSIANGLLIFVAD